ncbi:hypothetical protein FB567DRAFT_625427 [Paraphoma chrysanthemicola]|uniref:DUF7779 domain-containing protein n=1 Tax=Paraphoma chrysanthemicola TaxID=798071 RepID=A0A8K0RDT0_9PLEO|nr:hypothetical protein FB567DRAFT_625427 [Paraphoma chrysanthemicola]
MSRIGASLVVPLTLGTLCKSGDDDVKDNKPLSWPRCYAIYGPGGMGKTQVAAHFVSEHRKKFDAVLWVLQWFEKHEGSQKFLDWRFTDNQRPLSNYEYNVASVWAFDRLGKGEPLINISSMLDPDAIPESLFTSAAREEDSDLVQLIKSDFLSSRNDLLARSLITGNKREKKLFVHKLVQDVARSRMRPSDIRRNFWACVELINTIWPFQELTWRHGVARWADCEALFPHVQRLKAIYPSISPSPDSFEDYEFARLLIDSGWYQHERGKSLDAILSNNMAQSICESLKLRLLENPSLAKGSSVPMAQLNYSLVEMAHNRGCIALEINEPVDALKFNKLFNDTMVRDRSAHDHEYMRLAISWNELGSAHMLNRDWAKSEQCLLKSIEEMRKYTKFKPTTISLPLANLGLAYWLQGKNNLARNVLLEGLTAREAEFGIDDGESFTTGRFLHALGNVESSLDYHRRALMHYKSTLGNRHHRTADVFVKVAEHNIRLGNNELALVLLDFSMDAFSVSHTYMPEKTRAGWMRYKALKGLGKMAEAEEELAKCYQVYYKLRTTRNDSVLEIKKAAKELNDRDIDDLIVFWSK